MREATLSIRERDWFGKRLAMVGAFYRRHRIILIVWLLGAPFMAGVGAFDTSLFPAAIVYPYWLVLMFAGAHIAMFALDRVEALGIFRDAPIGRAAIVVLALGLFLTPLVYLMAAWLLSGSWAIERNLALLPQVLLVAIGFATIQLLARREAGDGEIAPAPVLQQPPALPVDLDGPLYVVEAEDHYLRFHTRTSSVLVLMRFRDALAELEHLDGAQVHRSWWVARAAVAHVARKQGRATMTLGNGLTVPVSRSHAPALRQAGWFRRTA